MEVGEIGGLQVGPGHGGSDRIRGVDPTSEDEPWPPTPVRSTRASASTRQQDHRDTAGRPLRSVSPCGYLIATGTTGAPVPPVTGSGVAESRNVYRPSAAQSARAPRGSSSDPGSCPSRRGATRARGAGTARSNSTHLERQVVGGDRGDIVVVEPVDALHRRPRVGRGVADPVTREEQRHRTLAGAPRRRARR